MQSAHPIPASMCCANSAWRFLVFIVQFAIMTAPCYSQRHLDWVIEQSQLFEMSCIRLKDPGAKEPTQVTKKENKSFQAVFGSVRAIQPYRGREREKKKNGLASYWVHERKAV